MLRLVFHGPRILHNLMRYTMACWNLWWASQGSSGHSAYCYKSHVCLWLRKALSLLDHATTPQGHSNCQFPPKGNNVNVLKVNIHYFSLSLNTEQNLVAGVWGADMSHRPFSLQILRSYTGERFWQDKGSKIRNHMNHVNIDTILTRYKQLMSVLTHISWEHTSLVLWSSVSSKVNVLPRFIYEPFTGNMKQRRRFKNMLSCSD